MTADSSSAAVPARRVAHLIGAGIGGAELQLLSLLAEEPDPSRHHNVVLLVRDGPLTDRFSQLVPTIVLAKRWKLDPFFWLRLVRTLRRARPDVLHTWTDTPNLWGPSAARVAGVPAVVLAEAALEEWKGAVLRAADRLNYRLCDRVVGCADAVTQAALSRGAPPDRTVTVPLGVALPRGIPDVEPDERGTVLLLGRFDPRKGHEVLLQALPAVRDAVPGLRVVLAGPAARPEEVAVRRRVVELVDALGLQDVVAVRDHVLAADALRHASVVVVPSVSEGLPNVVLEAMAASRPVVATCVGGIPEVVRDGDTGWLVPAGDQHALSNALVSALVDREEALRRARRGRAVVAERAFGPVLAMWHREYDEALEHAARTRPHAEPRA